MRQGISDARITFTSTATGLLAFSVVLSNLIISQSHEPKRSCAPPNQRIALLQVAPGVGPRMGDFTSGLKSDRRSPGSRCRGSAMCDYDRYGRGGHGAQGAGAPCCKMGRQPDRPRAWHWQRNRATDSLRVIVRRGVMRWINLEWGARLRHTKLTVISTGFLSSIDFQNNGAPSFKKAVFRMSQRRLEC